MHRIFKDPSVRKIIVDLHAAAHERHRAAVIHFAVGTMAATSTFVAGIEILGLGAIMWRLTNLVLLAPLLSALQP